MPGVTIQERAFTDPRFKHLGRLIGIDADGALGKMARVWHYCLEHQCYIVPLPLIDELIGEGGADKVIEAGLGERKKTGIRIKGTKGRIEWLGKLREGARRGGQKTRQLWKDSRRPLGLAEARWGQGLPQGPSVSSSASASITNTKDKDLCGASAPPALTGGVMVPVSESNPEKTANGKGKEARTAEAKAVLVALLEFWNRKAGRNFEPTEFRARMVRRLLDDGYAERDMRLVVWSKELGPENWAGNPKMAKFRRPETLFSREHFQDYLEQARTEWGDDGTNEERRGA